MVASNKNELVKRISKLAKQNRELEEKLKKLLKQNERLLRENEELKESAGTLKTTVDSEKSGRSLRFNMVTVLFANMHGFSKLVEDMDSTSVMDELDEVLIEFDAIVAKYKIEKIKTIGDTFMCAGGIPDKNITNPVEVVMAAIEMRNFLNNYEIKKRGLERKIWELKIGIHTGPVTALVSGKKKVSYDIKGDTVNTASRIEAVSEQGSILISVMTYELVKEFFDCEYFGKLPVKYKDDLQMFLVRGLKPEFSIDGKGVFPNDAFRIKFGLIQFTDIQEIILDKLEKELPPYLFYHNVKHTVDVVTEVELIGWAEGCNDEEILLLKTAALFHDVGHTVSYDDHEYHGTLIAREMLPSYGYTQEQIETICSIIMDKLSKAQPSEEIIMIQILITLDAAISYLYRILFSGAKLRINEIS